mmetsp:Transcript_25747/g.84753  ORF Transcript_25747/g.84753 Transcript_25747/m.84753 type:complete len:259 (+) Transcript_25747:335-1111(+)
MFWTRSASASSESSVSCASCSCTAIEAASWRILSALLKAWMVVRVCLTLRVKGWFAFWTSTTTLNASSRFCLAVSAARSFCSSAATTLARVASRFASLACSAEDIPFPRDSIIASIRFWSSPSCFWICDMSTWKAVAPASTTVSALSTPLPLAAAAPPPPPRAPVAPPTASKAEMAEMADAALIKEVCKRSVSSKMSIECSSCTASAWRCIAATSAASLSRASCALRWRSAMRFETPLDAVALCCSTSAKSRRCSAAN